MRRDHRPYWMKRTYRRLQDVYAKRRLVPHFESVGEGFTFIKPWYVEVFGEPVSLGRHAVVIASPDKRVRLSVWSAHRWGSITIGDWCMLCPGAWIGSAERITIGDNCMIAMDAYITDCDWHGLYDRVSAGRSAAVSIGDNVWIGARAVVCKGVVIGENAVVGAGAVVVENVPENAVVGGNPARIVKRLEGDREFVKRKQWFADPISLAREIDALDRQLLTGNTLWHWIRHILYPGKDH